MNKRTHVIVLGSSLHMAGIAASLKGDASLQVVHIDSHSPTFQERLNELHPAVIAFDLSDPSCSVDVSLLRERPGLLLVGVDPASDDLLVLSSQQERAVAVTDLLRVIHRGDEERRERRGDRMTIADPQQAAGDAGLGLTAEQLAALKTLDAQTIAEALDVRLIKKVGGGQM